MRRRVIELITREAEHQRAGRPARIVAKMNQVEDPERIAALCEASRAGVPIDLIVRGFCCLRPGIPGFSESIRVRSVIGRFLEHSRIFYFAAGSADPLDGEFFIGLADWMFRTLSHRVEVVTPVFARSAREKLWEILDVSLGDQRQAWVMASDGQCLAASARPRRRRPGERRHAPDAHDDHAATRRKGSRLTTFRDPTASRHGVRIRLERLTAQELVVPSRRFVCSALALILTAVCVHVTPAAAQPSSDQQRPTPPVASDQEPGGWRGRSSIRCGS